MIHVELQPVLENADEAYSAMEESLGKSVARHLYRKIHERVGSYPGAEIGHGEMGVVYELTDNAVLKITADYGELHAMELLRRNGPHPNLVRVDDVFIACKGSNGIGVIVREWVGTPFWDSPEAEIVEPVLGPLIEDAFKFYAQDTYRNVPILKAKKDAMGTVIEGLKKATPENEASRKVIDGMLSALVTLDNLGIYTLDFSKPDEGEGNIALDINGNPVLFDIGYASIRDYDSIRIDHLGCKPKGVL
jgi:serine/threonine protein kinase